MPVRYCYETVKKKRNKYRGELQSGNLQPAKIHYTAAWEICSLRKFITQLHGEFAACKNSLHGCMGNLQLAKIYYTAAWRLRSLRKHFTWLHEGFVAYESILHGCLEVS